MSTADRINQLEATHDMQNGADCTELSDEGQVVKEIVPTTPDGPLSENIYIHIHESHHDFFGKSLDAWKEPISQENNLLPNGFCQRCNEIASNDLELVRALRLDNSQTAVIRLGKSDARCKSCRLFARRRLDGFIMGQKRDYFLVNLAAMNLDLRPVEGRLCIVTKDPRIYASTYKRENQFPIHQLMLPMDAIPLCSQDGTRHLPFGQDEYESISQWLRTCMTDHPKECPQTPVRDTFTVYCIDCKDERVVPIPYNAKYLALSYVWGDAKASNDDGHLSDASPIIKDAMIARDVNNQANQAELALYSRWLAWIATLRLCFRYLWVDRYCINQHDTTQKHQQIANMGNIYAGATLTFIAAGRTDHAVGLPGVSSCQCNSGAESQLGPYSFVRFFSNPKDEIRGSQWATRGWTYQEAVMSVRKLVFTSNGFYTQCNIQHSFGNSHPVNGQTIILSRKNTEMDRRLFRDPEPSIATTVVFPGIYTDQPIRPSKSVLDEFFDHISEYIPRHLSYESDRLNAIQGVLNEFRLKKEPLFQIFGIPFNPASEWTVNATLLWRMQNHRVRRRTDFPSWSWLGWQYIDKIPDRCIFLSDLGVPAYRVPRSRRFYRASGAGLSLDEHSARISVEFLGGGLLNLTEAHQSSIAVDVALPREARIMPHLVIHGISVPFILDRDEINDWVHVDALSRPFHRKSSLLPFEFRMWLDLPDAQEKDGFHRNQARELFLGRFGVVIRVLILRENGDAWTRIGIGEYSGKDSTTNEYGVGAVEKAYLKSLKRFEKSTIRLT